MKKILFLACFVSACGGGGGDNDRAPTNSIEENIQPVENMSAVISTLESADQTPQLDRGDSLAGTDVNNNDIRDNIDTYIAFLPLTISQKSVIKNLSRNLQAIQVLDISKLQALQASADNLSQSIVCLSASFENPKDAHEILKSFEGYTADTRDRAYKYNAFNAARDGFVSRLPSLSQC